MKRIILSTLVSLCVAMSTPLNAKTKTWQDSRAQSSEIKSKQDVSKLGVRYELDVIFDHTESGHKTVRFLLNPIKEQSNCDFKIRPMQGTTASFSINGTSVKGILVCHQHVDTKKKSASIYPSSWGDRKAVIDAFKVSDRVKFALDRLVFDVPADGFTKAWGTFSQ